VPFGRFLVADAAAALISVPVVFGLAFLFTDQLQHILAGVHRVERWVPILVLLAVGAWIGVRAYRRSGALEPERRAGREEAAC
jgi:membrane protein DedA with SNARE-associated domain